MRGDEHVIPVPAKSTKQLLDSAERFLDEFQPERLTTLGCLDYPRLAERELERRKIFVYGDDTLGDEGLTKLSDQPGCVEILLPTEYYDALFEHNRHTHRARTTLIHEVGHALLHAKTLKRLSKVTTHWADGRVLHRKRVRDLKTYVNPEWQAWTFAGAVMFPIEALRKASGKEIGAIAQTCGLSEDMVTKHVHRLRRWGFNIYRGTLHVP